MPARGGGQKNAVDISFLRYMLKKISKISRWHPRYRELTTSIYTFEYIMLGTISDTSRRFLTPPGFCCFRWLEVGLFAVCDARQDRETS